MNNDYSHKLSKLSSLNYLLSCSLFFFFENICSSFNAFKFLLLMSYFFIMDSCDLFFSPQRKLNKSPKSRVEYTQYLHFGSKGNQRQIIIGLCPYLGSLEIALLRPSSNILLHEYINTYIRDI